MTRNVLVADLAIAVAVAVIVLIISPGYAISGLLAIIVLLVCGVSLLRERRGGGRRLRSAGSGRGGRPVSSRRAGSRRARSR
jgi:hypothetical protein